MKHGPAALPGEILALVPFLLVIVTASFAGAWTVPPAFEPAYTQLRDLVYQNAPIAQIRKSYETADSLRAIVIQDRDESAYWSARIEYLAGRAENELRNWKAADSHLAIGLTAVQRHLDRCSCDEGWRVKSAILGQMCLVKIRRFEYWWVFLHGLDVSHFADEALKAQPKNGKAKILVGSTLVYPPLIYGGNPKRGIEVMNDALSMPDIEKDDMFNIFSGIGIAYGRLDKKPEALAYLNKALMLYPSNRYANEKFRDIAAGRHVEP